MTDTELTVLGFDYGNARIGVARVNTLVKIPEPLGVIETRNQEVLNKLISEHQPDRLVVGLPRGLDGQETEQTDAARQFAASLKVFNRPIFMQDEALSSVEAEARLKLLKKPISVDAMAAVIILEDYLSEVKG